MKTTIYLMCAVFTTALSLSCFAQVQPKSKKVTELKYSGRIQAQWDGILPTEIPKKIEIIFTLEDYFLEVMQKWVKIGEVIS